MTTLRGLTTGQRVSVRALDVVRIAEGRIAEVRDLQDRYAMFSQLGLLAPAPSPASGKAANT